MGIFGSRRAFLFSVMVVADRRFGRFSNRRFSVRAGKAGRYTMLACDRCSLGSRVARRAKNAQAAGGLLRWRGLYPSEEIFKTNRTGAMSRDGECIVHNRERRQNDVDPRQLLVFDIRRGLAMYIKDIQTKVDRKFFLYHFGASVQQRMHFLTENLRDDTFNVRDFLGTMGYGILFHGTGTGSFDCQVLRHLTMSDALLRRFAQGNLICPEFMRDVYWASTNGIIEPVIDEDLVPGIRGWTRHKHTL